MEYFCSEVLLHLTCVIYWALIPPLLLITCFIISPVCLPQLGHIWAILDACDSTLWVRLKQCDHFTPLAPYWPGHRSPLYIPSLPACWRDLWLCLKKRKTSCQRIQVKKKKNKRQSCHWAAIKGWLYMDHRLTRESDSIPSDSTLRQTMQIIRSGVFFSSYVMSFL